jgi:hypothetical protein
MTEQHMCTRAKHHTKMVLLVAGCRSVPQLRQLSLSFNPVQQHKAYTAVVSELRNLSSLDGEALLQQEQAAVSCLTPALLCDEATLWHSTSGKQGHRAPASCQWQVCMLDSTTVTRPPSL